MISAIDLAGAFAMTIIIMAGMSATIMTAPHPAGEAVQIAIHNAAASDNTHAKTICVFEMRKDMAPAFERDVTSRQRVGGVE
jgi:ethanolamine transporter EutH